MGCMCCKPLTAESVSLSPAHFRSLLMLKDMLHLTRHDIDRMWGLFKGIDRDGSGHICFFEFLMYLDLDRSPFVEKAFVLADADGTDNMDFAEFVGSLYVYCTFSWDGLVKYAFDVCDVDRSGVLEVSEVEELVKSVYGKALDSRVEQLLRAMDQDLSGTISYDEFRSRMRHHPLLLFPAFHIQERMRSKTLGASYWKRREEKSYDPEHRDHIVRVFRTLDPASGAPREQTPHPRAQRRSKNASEDHPTREKRRSRTASEDDDRPTREQRRSKNLDENEPREKRRSKNLDENEPREKRRSRHSDDDFLVDPLAPKKTTEEDLEQRKKRRSRDLAHAAEAKRQREKRKSREAGPDGAPPPRKSAYERELEANGYHAAPGGGRVLRKTPTPEEVAAMFDGNPPPEGYKHVRPEGHHHHQKKSSRVAPHGAPPGPKRDSLITQIVRSASGKFTKLKQMPKSPVGYMRARKSKYAVGK